MEVTLYMIKRMQTNTDKSFKAVILNCLKIRTGLYKNIINPLRNNLLGPIMIMQPCSNVIYSQYGYIYHPDIFW